MRPCQAAADLLVDDVHEGPQLVAGGHGSGRCFHYSRHHMHLHTSRPQAVGSLAHPAHAWVHMSVHADPTAPDADACWSHTDASCLQALPHQGDARCLLPLPLLLMPVW